MKIYTYLIIDTSGYDVYVLVADTEQAARQKTVDKLLEIDEYYLQCNDEGIVYGSAEEWEKALETFITTGDITGINRLVLEMPIEYRELEL